MGISNDKTFTLLYEITIIVTIDFIALWINIYYLRS